MPDLAPGVKEDGRSDSAPGPVVFMTWCGVLCLPGYFANLYEDVMKQVNTAVE